MDADAIVKGIGLFNSAVVALKQVIELLPDSPKKDDAEAALKRAEREFKIAEAQIATKLGYQLCRKHFPPEIMLSSDDESWKCPNCGNETELLRKRTHKPLVKSNLLLNSLSNVHAITTERRV